MYVYGFDFWNFDLCDSIHASRPRVTWALTSEVVRGGPNHGALGRADAGHRSRMAPPRLTTRLFELTSACFFLFLVLIASFLFLIFTMHFSALFYVDGN